MEQPILVDRKVVKILGKVCDAIVFRVTEGHEDAWADAAQLWVTSYRADVGSQPGLVQVVGPRQHVEVPVDTEAVFQAIVHQRAINLGRPA